MASDHAAPGVDGLVTVPQLPAALPSCERKMEVAGCGTNYPPELRERAIRIVAEERPEYRTGR